LRHGADRAANRSKVSGRTLRDIFASGRRSSAATPYVILHARSLMDNSLARAHSSRLDPYVDRYAARTAGMTAPQIRAALSVASRPEVVSLAGGMPNISGLPLDVVGGAISDLIATQGPVAMQYGSGQGVPALREQITDVMRLEGIEAHADDVVVTVGS